MPRYVPPPIPDVPLTDEWVRLPKPDQKLNGLSRASLLELHRLGYIKIAKVKTSPHNKRCINLVHLPTLRNYLYDLTRAEKM